jgi:hypothetical protein
MLASAAHGPASHPTPTQRHGAARCPSQRRAPLQRSVTAQHAAQASAVRDPRAPGPAARAHGASRAPSRPARRRPGPAAAARARLWLARRVAPTLRCAVLAAVPPPSSDASCLPLAQQVPAYLPAYACLPAYLSLPCLSFRRRRPSWGYLVVSYVASNLFFPHLTTTKGFSAQLNHSLLTLDEGLLRAPQRMLPRPSEARASVGIHSAS